MGCSCVTPGQQQARELSWLDGSAPEALSADGRTVLLSEMLRGAGPNGAIYLRKTDGSDAVRRGDGFGDDLSPDGKWVLASPVPWRQHWILVPTGPGSPRILPPGPLVALGDARFLPNGRQIVFGGREKDRGARIYVQDIEVSAVSFRDFVLDLDTRELRRGGDSVSLSRQRPINCWKFSSSTDRKRCRNQSFKSDSGPIPLCSRKIWSISSLRSARR
jgi:hypothetical protein